jgi:hypothetical protein
LPKEYLDSEERAVLTPKKMIQGISAEPPKGRHQKDSQTIQTTTEAGNNKEG